MSKDTRVLIPGTSGEVCAIPQRKTEEWDTPCPCDSRTDFDRAAMIKRYIPRPVLVIVDTRQSTVGIPTEAYFAVEEIKDVRDRPDDRS